MNTRRFTALMAGVACIVGAFAAGCNNDTPDDAASPGTEAGGTMASPGAGGTMASPGAGGTMASPGASGGTMAPPGPTAK